MSIFPKEVPLQQKSGFAFKLDKLGNEKEKGAERVFANNGGIESKKTFENFVVGSSNNLAAAAALEVANAAKGEMKYPCLYIYGGSGLGKTHLLHAIANGIRANNPKQTIRLLSGREFMKEQIDFSLERKLTQFQKKYGQDTDVLLIDEIQGIKQGERTREEFFHILDEFYSRKKHLVFTSDKAPQDIAGLEERIISRLQSGLVVDIQPPDFETRIAILKRKALEVDLFLPEDVLQLMASLIKANIRELEGGLIKLKAYADVMEAEVDVEMASKLLKLSPAKSEKQLITVESVAVAVSRHYKISLDCLKSKAKNKEIVKVRHIAWHLSKELADAGLKEIARYYDRRNHSSIVYGINKISDYLRETPAMVKEIAYIKGLLFKA